MRYRLGSYIRHRDGVQYRAFIEILGRRRSQVVPNAETAKRLLRTWSEEKVLIENRGHAVRRPAQPDVTYAEMGKHLEGDRPFIHVAVRSEADRTKAGRARDVPVLTPELLETLKAVPLGPADQALFGSRDQDYRFDFLQSFWKAVLDQPAQLHQLRHRWVTRLLAGGTPTAVVQRWAGHANSATTDRYAHVDGREVPGAARKALRRAPSHHRTGMRW